MKKKLEKKVINLRLSLIILVVLFIIAVFSYTLLSRNNIKISSIQYKNGIRQLVEKTENIEENQEGITYYISVKGTSQEGTDINDPMSLEIAKAKVYRGNDKILFKSDDIFYDTINLNIQTTSNSYVYIGAYGNGNKPTISGAKILCDKEKIKKIEGDNEIYKINLSNNENFDGIKLTTDESCNVGFILDDKGNIYGNRKKSIDLLKENMDFYCEDNNIYIKCDENPIEKLGILKVATNLELFKVSNNTVIDGLKFEITGAHAIVKRNYPIKNVYVKNCLIENIGGSVQVFKSFTRYGNAIEFWLGAENILIENNIIKNVYDAAITLQGDSGSFKNIDINNNILISNCYSIELWATGKSTGMTNVNIYSNISINEGNGWGQKVRPNPYNSAEFVFYSYAQDAKMDINIHNNTYYNSTRLYYVLYSIKDRFKEKVKIDNNSFRIKDGSYVVNDNKSKNIKEYLNKEYNQDQNSTFKLLTDAQVEQISNPEILNSNDYNEIKTYYEELEKEFEYTELKQEIIEKYNNFLVSNETLISPINNINNNINSIIGRIEDMTLDTTNEASLKEIINIIYSVESNIIGANVNKNITTTEMIKLINELNELAQNMNIIYSKVEISNAYDKNEIAESIQESQNYINSNKDLEIDNLVELSKIGNEISNKETTTYADYLYAITLSNWTDNVLNTKIKDYIAQNPVTIEYSETNITNKSVKATIKTNAEIQITNNSNSKEYVFDQNGSFTFEYTIKGQAKQITAKVTNIDKTLPIINGVVDGKLYTSKITPTITDENIDTIKLILNGEEVMNFKSGTTLTEEGFYTLTAIDKAGNKTQISFQIMENNNQNYIIQDNIIKNISEQTKKSDFDNKLKLELTYKITRNDEEINEKDNIATGDVLTTSAGDKYTLIVTGDLNKDGKLNLKDLVKMRKYFLDGNNLDENEMLAADCNFDGKINLKDLVKMRLIILNKESEN